MLLNGRNTMSNKTYNEELPDKILEELDNISLTDFQSLMTKHDYHDVNEAVDYGIQNLIQILFDERCRDE